MMKLVPARMIMLIRSAALQFWTERKQVAIDRFVDRAGRFNGQMKASLLQSGYQFGHRAG